MVTKVYKGIEREEDVDWLVIENSKEVWIALNGPTIFLFYSYNSTISLTL